MAAREIFLFQVTQFFFQCFIILMKLLAAGGVFEIAGVPEAGLASGDGDLGFLDGFLQFFDAQAAKGAEMPAARAITAAITEAF